MFNLVDKKFISKKFCILLQPLSHCCHHSFFTTVINLAPKVPLPPTTNSPPPALIDIGRNTAADQTSSIFFMHWS